MSTNGQSHLASTLRALIAESGVFTEHVWSSVISMRGEESRDAAKRRLRDWYDDRELPTPKELRDTIAFAANAEATISEWLMRPSESQSDPWFKMVVDTRDRWWLGKHRIGMQEALAELQRGMARRGEHVTPLWEQAVKAVPGARTLGEYAYLPVYTEQLMRGLSERSTAQLEAGTKDFDHFVRQRVMHVAQEK